MSLPIEVPERGSKTVDAATWRRLRSSESFWLLVSSKVLKAEALRDGRATLSGGAYVGRAEIDGMRLDVVEKIPGALASLLKAHTPGLKAVKAPSTGSSLQNAVDVIVSTFLAEVQAYLGAGRQWRYTSKLQVSSNISGRLRAVDTVRLRARGIRHMVAFDRATTTRLTPLNVVVAAALREVEVLRTLGLARLEQVNAGRLAAVSFADIPFQTPVPVGWRAEDVPEQWRQLAELAEAVLAHLGPGLGEVSVVPVPRAWFVNLEALFEHVVRRELGRLSQLQVSKGGGPDVLCDVGSMRASPDLILRSGDAVVGIGDVKYKDRWGSPAHDDVYQLLAHGNAFECRSLFLVYPGDSTQAVLVGTTIQGYAVTAHMVDLKNTTESLTRLAEALESRVRRHFAHIEPGPRWV